MTQPRNVAAEWNASAPYWEKHATLVRELMQPISDALIGMARLRPGQAVLDVAGGTGEPASTVATVVGRDGHVVCTDLVLAMVAAASRLARRRSLDNLEFSCCDAGSLPYVDHVFDAVVCRLGAMFFPDVEAAIREMLRVQRPGGTAAMVVWADRASNPFFSVVTDVLEKIAPSPPEDPEAPGAFRFSAPGKLARLVEAAGARNVVEAVVDFRMETRLDPESFWQMRREISDSLRSKTAALTDEQMSRLSDGVHEGVRRFFRDGRVSFPARVIVVTAMS